MDEPGTAGSFPASAQESAMKPATAQLLVPFREVRHSRPDDCLHYEPIGVRGVLFDWTIPAHRHDGLHQFQLIERGAAAAVIDGREAMLEAPAILMIAPGTVHGFCYAPQTVGHQVTIPTTSLERSLQGAECVESLLAESFILDRSGLAEDDARYGSRLFESLAAEFVGYESGRVQVLLAQATLVAVWFLRRHQGKVSDARAPGLRDALVKRFRSLLEAHYREHRPLAFYAEALQVTADHLSRTCRAVAGQSALEMIHARTVLEARRLLAYTSQRVAEVGEALGFADPAYFSRFFARAVGESPTRYRHSVLDGVQVQAEAATGDAGERRR